MKDTLGEFVRLTIMNLRSVAEIENNKRVILRMDLDVPIEVNQVVDNSRLKKSLPTLRMLLDKKNARVVIIGHRGRPEGRDEKFSLRPVYLELVNLLEDEGDLYETVFIENIEDSDRLARAINTNHVVVVENLRFWKGEEENDAKFLDELVGMTDAFVNDAITVAHRKHASVMLFEKMDSYYGLNFIEEIEGLNKAIENPVKPVTVILGGAKEDKLKYLDEISKKVDNVLLGGMMPIFVEGKTMASNVEVAKLKDNKLDISDDSIKSFRKIIEKAGTIIWAGSMGKYEDEDNKRGTMEIAGAIAKSKAYSILGGGDTSAALRNMGLIHKISFVSSGGGVMLEYLAKGKLAAWK